MAEVSTGRDHGNRTRRPSRRTRGLLNDRTVSSGSVFSTILITMVVSDMAPADVVDRLVDVGCGDSPYRSSISHQQYIGIDRRPRGSETMLTVGDATSLPLVSGSANAILCTEVIEHVLDERSLALELHRIACVGAPLLLSAPFVHGLHEQPFDFRRLTSLGLMMILEEAGWQVEEVASIGGPVVVALDGCVRWCDSMWHRVLRFVAPNMLASRFRMVPSELVQRALAAIVSRQSNYLGPVDPAAAVPRLTLGYVVRARRMI